MGSNMEIHSELSTPTSTPKVGDVFQFAGFRCKDQNGRIIPPEKRHSFQRLVAAKLNDEWVDLHKHDDKGGADCFFYFVPEETGEIEVRLFFRENSNSPWFQSIKRDGTIVWQVTRKK